MVVWWFCIFFFDVYFFNLGFGEFYFFEGVKLDLYFVDQKIRLGFFILYDNDDYREFWMFIMDGDEMVVEFCLFKE